MRLVASAMFAVAAYLVCSVGSYAATRVRGIALVENEPWLVKNRGPGAAKGVIYFVHGYSSAEPLIDDFKGIPPYIVSLNEKGWDVIGAHYPEHAPHTFSSAALVPEFAPALATKAEALRREGYKRVIVGGQSWGGWLSLAAARHYGMKADGLILMVPTEYGKRINPKNGRLNPNFVKNKSDFLPLIDGLTIPSVAIFFQGDEFDPGGRGAYTETSLTKRAIPHVVIDQPPGFKGHGSGWFPLFDYEYGECVATFLSAPQTTACSARALDNADFRSIISKSQISDAEKHPTVSLSELVGRRFAVYVEDGFARMINFPDDKTEQVVRPTNDVQRTMAARDGAVCLDDHCYSLVKWDQHRLIAFDPNSGAATSWWVEFEGNSK